MDGRDTGGRGEGARVVNVQVRRSGHGSRYGEGSGAGVRGRVCAAVGFGKGEEDRAGEVRDLLEGERGVRLVGGALFKGREVGGVLQRGDVGDVQGTVQDGRVTGERVRDLDDRVQAGEAGGVTGEGTCG